MTSSGTEYDYEAIFKHYVQKAIATDVLEDKKNDMDSKLWDVAYIYYDVKNKFELAEKNNDVLKILTSNKGKMRNNSDQEHVFLNRKLHRLQQIFKEIDIKGQDEMKNFFDIMDRLYKDLWKLPKECGDKNMNHKIGNYIKFVDYFEKQIEDTKKNLDILKSTVEDFQCTGNILNARDVAEIIQKESFEKYGDSTKLQYRLSEMRQTVKFLSKKVLDTKVKYGVN